MFAQLLDGKYSADLKKLVYQLRLQSLNPQSPAPEDVAKIEDVAKRLLKEEDEQLQALGIAVKGQLLIQAAQKDPKAVPALDKYADEVLEQAKKNPAVKTQGVGMKIQAFRLKEDAEGLMAFIDAQLAEEDGALAMQLTQVKLTLISDAVAADASKFAKYAAFVEEAAKNEELAQAVDNVYSAKYSAAFSKLAEDGCTKAEFQALLAQFQAELEKRPAVVSALLIARESINQIGEKVGDVKLFNAAFKDTIEFCKNSKVEALAALGANLETYAAQMEQLEQAAPAEKAE
ncbi:MAG: hypothetical protein HUK22_03880 [Thermoguttaceae bacterium]|nr:hypothetical protein [Thermoguttaceae bacterium]